MISGAIQNLELPQIINLLNNQYIPFHSAEKLYFQEKHFSH
jgi:hypothetical protein